MHVTRSESPVEIIPVKAGIQSFHGPAKSLDSGFHRSDGFLLAL